MLWHPDVTARVDRGCRVASAVGFGFDWTLNTYTLPEHVGTPTSVRFKPHMYHIDVDLERLDDICEAVEKEAAQIVSATSRM